MGGCTIHTPKKILILYASAGHGHEKAAKALLDQTRKQFPDAKVRCEDTVKLFTRFYGWQYRAVYFFLIGKVPWLWGFYYSWFDRPWMEKPMAAIRRFLNGIFGDSIERLLKDFFPDVVLTTHFTGNEVVGYLKRHGDVSCQLYTVLTDFAAHRLWINPAVDGYFVASDSTRQGLVDRGVNPERIEVTGIPIHERFTQFLDRDFLCSKYSLDAQKFTYLLTSGGAAVGDLHRIATTLSASFPDAQGLIVCGTNVELHKHIEELGQTNRNIRSFGFVDNMHELMEIAHVVLGKAGGLTVSESVTKKKPMILFKPIPGQEQSNARVIADHEAGILAHNFSEIRSSVEKMINSPEYYQALSKAAASLSSANACDKIISHIKIKIANA